MTIGKMIALVALVAAIGFLAFKYGVVERGDDGSFNISEETIAAARPDAMTEANLLFGQAKYDAALARYREALADKSDPKSTAAARFRIARCLEKLGRNSEAAKAYAYFASQFPNDSRAQEARKKQAMLEGS